MVQGLPAEVPVQAEVLVVVLDAAEAEWVGHLLQGQVEVVYAQVVDISSLMLQDSLVMHRVVQNVVRK